MKVSFSMLIFFTFVMLKIPFCVFRFVIFFYFRCDLCVFFVFSPRRIRTRGKKHEHWIKSKKCVKKLCWPSSVDESVIFDVDFFDVDIFYFQSDLCVFLYLAPGGYEHMQKTSSKSEFSVISVIFGDFRWFFVFVSSVQITVKRVSSVVIRVERVSSVVIRVERVYSVVIGFETGFRVKLTL